jgi:hypothetical protein
MKTVFIALLTLVTLTGCVTTGLYDWGHYEDDLFDYYHQPGEKEKAIADLEKLLAKQEAKGRKPAPGLYAELGTFYLLEGDSATAIGFYQKEAEYWPESEPMMSTLISNLEGQ